MQSNDGLAEDLLSGVPQIAAFLGMPQSTVYYLAERKQLPLFKMSKEKTGKWLGRKSVLREHIAKREAANV